MTNLPLTPVKKVYVHTSPPERNRNRIFLAKIFGPKQKNCQDEIGYESGGREGHGSFCSIMKNPCQTTNTSKLFMPHCQSAHLPIILRVCNTRLRHSYQRKPNRRRPRLRGPRRRRGRSLHRRSDWRPARTARSIAGAQRSLH